MRKTQQLSVSNIIESYNSSSDKKTVNFSDKIFDDSDEQEVYDFLSAHVSEISELDLSKNELTAEYIKKVCMLFSQDSHSCLTRLDLSCNEVGNAGLLTILPLINEIVNRNGDVLLNFNNITSEGFKALLGSLPKDKKANISLNGNMIKDEDLKSAMQSEKLSSASLFSIAVQGSVVDKNLVETCKTQFSSDLDKGLVKPLSRPSILKGNQNKSEQLAVAQIGFFAEGAKTSTTEGAPSPADTRRFETLTNQAKANAAELLSLIKTAGFSEILPQAANSVSMLVKHSNILCEQYNSEAGKFGIIKQLTIGFFARHAGSPMEN